jgi:hypothetical protein
MLKLKPRLTIVQPIGASTEASNDTLQAPLRMFKHSILYSADK